MRKYALAVIAGALIAAGMVAFAEPVEANPDVPVAAHPAAQPVTRSYDLSRPEDRWALLWLMLGLNAEPEHPR